MSVFFLFLKPYKMDVRKRERQRELCIFFCMLLHVFPCSCTGCGVYAGQDTSLVQCVSQSDLLSSVRTFWLDLLNGCEMDLFSVPSYSTHQYYNIIQHKK